MNVYRWIVLSAVVMLSAVPVHAAVITGLYNTGVDNAGHLLAGGSIDPHYQLSSSPTATTPASSVVFRTDIIPFAVSPPGFPPPPVGWPIGNPWAGNTATSKWIGPNEDPGLDRPYGLYSYRTTFVLPYTAILSTVNITGLWASDDRGVDILINGISTGQSSPDGFQFNPFSITSSFHTGLNYITFIINNEFLDDGSNGWSPSGIQVRMSGTYEEDPAALPEPSTLLLFGVGVVGIAVLRRRRAS